MRRTGATFDTRYEAELVLIEFFALLVLLFLLSSGPAPNPVSPAAPALAAPPAATPAPAKEGEPPAAPGKSASALRHISRQGWVVVSIPGRKSAQISGESGRA